MFSVTEIEIIRLYLRRNREELSEIDLLDVRFSSFFIACSKKTKKPQTKHFDFLNKYLRKAWTKLTEVSVCAPLRSRSARMFIGPELSTHTISFKVSPQHECDALREKASHSLFTLHGNSLFCCTEALHSPDNCSQPWTKIQERLRGKRGISFLYLWQSEKKSKSKRHLGKEKKKAAFYPPLTAHHGVILLSNKDIYFVIFHVLPL